MLTVIDLFALQMLDGVGDQTLRKIILSKASISELMSSTEKDIALVRGLVIGGRMRDMQIRNAYKIVLFPTPFTPAIKLSPG